jgi:hypothetical protein
MSGWVEREGDDTRRDEVAKEGLAAGWVRAQRLRGVRGNGFDWRGKTWFLIEKEVYWVRLVLGDGRVWKKPRRSQRGNEGKEGMDET